MQTNQISSKEKKETQNLDKHSTESKPLNKDEIKKENKNGSKSKEKPYWEPIIPRSGRKDRLEIW